MKLTGYRNHIAKEYSFDFRLTDDEIDGRIELKDEVMQRFRACLGTLPAAKRNPDLLATLRLLARFITQ